MLFVCQFLCVGLPPAWAQQVLVQDLHMRQELCKATDLAKQTHAQ